jgi:hypothetical protein
MYRPTSVAIAGSGDVYVVPSGTSANSDAVEQNLIAIVAQRHALLLRLDSLFVSLCAGPAGRCTAVGEAVPLRSLSERIWYGKACRLPLPGRSRDASIQVK